MRAGVVGLHAMQHDQRAAGQTDADQRLLKAGTEAAHAGKLNVEAAALDGAVQGVEKLLRAVAAAAGTHADRDARNGRHQLGKPGFANRVECADVLNARHYFPPPLFLVLVPVLGNAFTSRCKVRSFTWLRMWWLTSTTGASAHWPKQATVRTVNLRSGVVSASLSASLVSLGFRIAQTQIEAELGEQVARAASVAGRSAADTDHVVALRIEIEERVESGRAVDARRGNAGLLSDVAQRLHGEVLVRVGGLDGLKNAEHGSGAVAMFGDHLVDEQLFVSVENFRDGLTGGGWHSSSPPCDLRTGSVERRGKIKEKSSRRQRFIYLAKENVAL